MPSLTGLELNIRNILKVLHEAGFADADWELLGLQLIEYSDLPTIDVNRRGKPNRCMVDTIFKWLDPDTEASWEKLAGAVAIVQGYGELHANRVREMAGIGKKG